MKATSLLNKLRSIKYFKKPSSTSEGAIDALEGFNLPRNELREILAPPKRGIEIGPSFNPILPKKNGYNVCVVDYLNEKDLHEKYKNDPNAGALIKKIEPVDLVDDGKTGFLEQLGHTEKFDFILSSHNFEHLPNPIKFLLRCQEALKDFGKCYFIIPDRRDTFDYFRPISSAGQVLEAYWLNASRPPLSAVFDQNAYAVHGNTPEGSTALLHDPLLCWKTVIEAFKLPDTYTDAHCFVYTPASFRLLINILQRLELTGFYLSELKSYTPFEFIGVLEKSDKKNDDDLDKLHLEVINQSKNSLRH